MRVELTVEELGGKNDYYLLTFKTYKETFRVKTERSNMRELMAKMDNAIGSNLEDVFITNVLQKDVNDIEVILDKDGEKEKTTD